MERIYEVLVEESDLSNGPNPIYEVPDGSIEFKNVDFSYSKDENKLVLENINFKINSGETVGIIGGTGSAKSSLVQLIPRLYDTTRGSVEVGGINVRYDMETFVIRFHGAAKECIVSVPSRKPRWGNKRRHG